jgi:hypothetical protein
VASEGFQRSLRESHGAAAALGLWRGENRSALRGCKSTPHLQSPALKVNVIPFESQQLSLPQPGGHGQDVESFKAISLGRIEQYPYLFRGQGPHFFSLYLWRLDSFGGVARDKPVPDSLLERLVKRDVDVLDGAGRESGIKLLAIESAHVGRGQVLELHLTQKRAYVEADHLLIPLKGCRTYGVTYRIGKPAPQVLTQLQIISVEHEPTISVCLGFGGFLVYFSARLAVQRLALRSSGRLDRVAGHVESILAAGDTTLTVSALTHA